jgi:hypothetical protein
VEWILSEGPHELGIMDFERIGRPVLKINLEESGGSDDIKNNSTCFLLPDTHYSRVARDRN